MHDRCFLDAILALTSFIINLKSPGTIQKDVTNMYRKNVITQVHKHIRLPEYFDTQVDFSLRQSEEPQDSNLPYERKVLYLWSCLIIVFIDDISGSIDFMEDKIRWGYSMIQLLANDRSKREQQLNSTNTNIQPDASQIPLDGSDLNSSSQDLYYFCYSLLLAIDLNSSNRSNQPFLWDFTVFGATVEKDLFSQSYTDSWWFTKCTFLLMRIQNFTYQHGPPTYEEYISNRRLKEWESIYKDLCEYGKALPQSLSPYAIIDRGSLDGHDIEGLYRQSTYRSSETSKIKEVHISSDLGVLVNIVYHCSVIWALHVKPDMTPAQKLEVPSGALEHALMVLGILSTYENQTGWIATHWCHRISTCCIEDPDTRDDALEISRQYEWQTGYIYEQHFHVIQKRWNEIDAHKNRKQNMNFV